MWLRIPGTRKRVMPTTRVVASVAIAALQAVLQAGCTDAPNQIAEPITPGVLASAVAGSPQNLEAGVVNCVLAVRRPSGIYRTKTVTIRVPRSIFATNANTVRFGFRGWVPGKPDPTRLALCTIPATPSAVEWFKELFRSSRSFPASSDGPVTSSGAPLGTTSAATDIVIVDGDGAQSPQNELNFADECDTAIIPPEHCDEWEEGGEEEGPPPSDPDQPEVSMDAAVDPLAPPDTSGVPQLFVPITCRGNTDYPHLSTTPGFGMNANVHGRTVCSQPVLMSYLGYPATAVMFLGILLVVDARYQPSPSGCLSAA